jgi:protease-4
MSEQNNNVDNEVLQIIKRFITEYDKREKSKVRISRIGALIKISFITIFVISLLMFYVPFLVKFHSMGQPQAVPKGAVSAIKIDKPIGSGSGMLSANQFSNLLGRAYRNGEAKGVVLYLNSPGGSPVESDVMYKRIEDYKEKFPHIKIVSVVQDMCASGCYYVASATDKIYASESSMIGSIGVIMSGFGFKESLEKLGIERRVFTAGESKSFMDPFSDINESNREHIENILADAHSVFKVRVKNGRGDRLKDDEYDDIFTGLVWLAGDAKERGLIDDIGNVFDVTKKEFGVDRFIFLENREKAGLLDLLSMNASGSIEKILSGIEDKETLSVEYR